MAKASPKAGTSSFVPICSTPKTCNMEEIMYGVWPLRTEDDYISAMELVDKLAVKGEENLRDEERSQLEVFTILMEAYEKEHHSIEKPDLSPLELLEFLMEESGMNQSDLGNLLGDRSLGHKILAGKRRLSKSHIKTLSEHFKVDSSLFL